MFTEKFSMFETLGETLGYCKDNWKKYGLNSVLIILLQVITYVITFSYLTKMVMQVEYSPFGTGNLITSSVRMILFTLPINLITVILTSNYIKITDDIYENRELSYKEQFVFVIKRLGRMILSYIIVFVPMALVNIIVSVTFLSYSNLFTTLISFALSIITYLFIMINQSIIIEDSTAIGGIKRSFTVMKKNILRFLGFSIVIGILLVLPVSVVAMIVMKVKVLRIIIYIILPFVVFFLAPLPAAFMTLLFKSVTHTPYDYIENSSKETVWDDREYE